MRLLVSITVMTALVAFTGLARADGIRKGPYLLRMGTSSVDMRVELAEPETIEVTVVADAPARDGGKEIHKVASPKSDLHSVHIDGLRAAERYQYTVKTGGNAERDGSFITAPPNGSHDPFSFVAFGDNRSDPSAHASVISAIAKENFDFLINTGDFVTEGSSEESWQSFFDIEEPILKDHCLFACVGNHELVSDRAAVHFFRYIDPTDLATGGSAPLHRSFRWGRARFFLLNAFADWAHGPDRRWLEGELRSADTEPGVDLRIAVLHHGPFSAGLHGDNEAIRAAEIPELLASHHVDLVLSGHDHIYERGEEGRLKYIVTGGGGAPLYPQIHALPSTRKVEATHHFVKLTVTDAGVAIVTKRPDGSVVEACSFERGGSWLCDPPPAPPPLPAAREIPKTPASPSSGSCEMGRRGGSEAAFALLITVALGLAKRRWARTGRA